MSWKKNKTNKLIVLLKFISIVLLILTSKEILLSFMPKTESMQNLTKGELDNLFNEIDYLVQYGSNQSKAVDKLKEASKLNKVINSTTTTDYWEVEIRISNQLCIAYMSTSDFASSAYHCERQLKLMHRFQEIINRSRGYSNDSNEILQSTVLQYIVYANTRAGNYRKALKYAKIKLDKSEKLSHPPSVAQDLSYIGNIYYSLGNYRKAVDNYRKASKTYRNYYEQGGCESLGHNCGTQSVIPFHSSDIGLSASLLELKRYAEAEKIISNYIQSFETGSINLLDDNNLTVFAFDDVNTAYSVYQRVLVEQEKYEEALIVSERGRTNVLENLILEKDNLSFNSESLTIDLVKQIAKDKNASIIEYSFVPKGHGLVPGELEIFVWAISPKGEVYFQTIDINNKLFAEVNIFSKLVNPIFLKKSIPIFLRILGFLLLLSVVILLIRFFLLQIQLESNFSNKLSVLLTKLSVFQMSIVTIIIFGCVAIVQEIGFGTFQFSPQFQMQAAKQTEISQLVESIEKTRNSIGISTRGISELSITESSNSDHELERLYKLLIEPVENYLSLNENSNLIFVPHFDLFLVPFAALKNRQNQYLIENHAVSVVPSLEILYSLSQRQQSVSAISEESALVVGNPTMPESIKFSFELEPSNSEPLFLEPLPYAEQEAEEIASFFKTTAITGDNATETYVKSKLSQTKILHLATHGMLFPVLETDRGTFTVSALALSPSETDDGILTADEISNFELTADLVVLSACQTGSGDFTTDGVLGLSRAFLSAGAPSLVVSLWQVRDDSTAFLMQSFYENIEIYQDKAKALQKAMIETMELYPHPSEWAAFVVIGNTY